MTVLFDDSDDFAFSVAVIVVGAGACGSVAALAAHGKGAEVLVLERDPVPRGNTALSGGQIPAGGTRLQQKAGIEDAPEILEKDILAKAKNQCDPVIAKHIALAARDTVDWLVEDVVLPLSCIDDFQYPGHSRMHMHASPSRFGAELMDVLTQRLSERDIDLLTSATVVNLFAARDGTIRGVRIARPDGSQEDVGCQALILACNGYGGNKELVARYIPGMSQAHYHGHPGNRGDAVIWGEQLGASIKDLGSYQGHGAVCTPHMVHLGWPVFTQGGFQVNKEGRRFSNENAGYSEQALKVLTQTDGLAWAIWDKRCDDIAMQMHSHVEAKERGAIKRFDSAGELAGFIGCDPATIQGTLDEVAAIARREAACPWGRDFGGFPALEAPYFCAKITGALFHTQGGLEVDTAGRVLRPDGSAFPNLFAGGGAARGVSGPADWGYMSGSGLMMAVNLGRLAGEAAAEQTQRQAA
ncbi:FAD-dependent oxidoreductase [Bosea sp. (in: a-proteobacteria)]|uniref:FAD-dependent oxidoreductase n=1 Tax=Bosea sp. (in: a-proteobacteria) TaxID=1871050 RepID=UPI002629A0B7|nr:FAD-dependent oxidoreductase [Bosea sp. (in: a-proteobacteria)]MCO5090599.1 FAD-dependent oxidoreductase [Bosea sp. (in: a-proteobacteria)]